MSHTWDYRFAFRLSGLDDVPQEFRGAYDRLVCAKGLPVFSLFTPSIVEHAFVVSRRLPPRVILVFPRSFVLLSLDTNSNAVGTFDLNRADFLGYGLAEFMLNCWFTVYHGRSEDGKTMVRLPARAGEHFWELSRLLLAWCRDGDLFRNKSQNASAMPGLPAKFLSFLSGHPEYGKISEFFFQPALPPRGKRGTAFANLLLCMVPSGIQILSDQNHYRRSETGLEMTFLPLSRIQSAGWIEPSQDGSALLRIDLHGEETHSQVNWHVLAGLKPYALRWIQMVNNAANTKRQRPQGSDERIEEDAPRRAVIPSS